jgi:hypothetical protein
MYNVVIMVLPFILGCVFGQPILLGMWLFSDCFSRSGQAGGWAFLGFVFAPAATLGWTLATVYSPENVAPLVIIGAITDVIRFCIFQAWNLERFEEFKARNGL